MKTKALPSILITSLSALLLCSSMVFGQFGLDRIGDVIKGVEGGKKLAKGSTGISQKEELDIGGSLAAEIASNQGGILKDSAVTKRVALIGKALTLYSTRPNLPYTFAVLDNSEINAFSCPGGYVLVTKGLVDSCSNDQQLAGVLAHEIAHITRRHSLKLIARDEAFKGGTEIFSAATGGDFSGYDDLVSKGVNTLLHKGFDPATEFDADLHGTRLIYDTGFPPPTLRDYLAKLKSESKPFSTHPPTDHRVDRLDEYLKKSGMVSGD
jgi:beta-barrel assembly-enhancing protease